MELDVDFELGAEYEAGFLFTVSRSPSGSLEGEPEGDRDTGDTQQVWRLGLNVFLALATSYLLILKLPSASSSVPRLLVGDGSDSRMWPTGVE